MSDEDVREFINNWHEAVIAHEPDLTEKAKLGDARDNLPKRLAEPANHRVKELCRSPLLCALICVLHWREEGYLPSRRVELYDRCCTMLIEERDAKRDIAKPKGPLQFLDLGGKEMILQRLAWSMMRNKSAKSEKTYQIEVTRAEAIAWIKPSVSALDSEEARKSSPEVLLDYLIERTGLLREPATGLVDFPHRTFQEYLAACAAGALNEAGDLAQRVTDDQWHETIVLAAGTKVGGVPFGNALVEELVSRGEKEEKQTGARHAYFALAVACLETGKQIREDLRSRVVTHLKEIVPPHDSIDARILSAAGDAVIPFLKYSRWGNYGVKTVSACARTLALIGSHAANKALCDPYGYGSDRRANVLVEICHCSGVQPLAIPRMVSIVQSFNKMPEMLKSFVSDLTPLLELPHVRHLNFSNCRNVSDITPLGSLLNLNYLNLGHTNVEDLSPLSRLQKLSQLLLYGCPVNNIGSIVNISSLTVLHLDGCRKLRDISPVVHLEKLESLSLTSCTLDNFDSLIGLIELQSLYVDYCKNFDVLQSLIRLQKLKLLNLSGCSAILDFNPLGSFPHLERLWLDNCAIESLESLAALKNLKLLSIRNCDKLKDFSSVINLPALDSVVISGCNINDFSPFAGEKLRKLIVDYNQINLLPANLKAKAVLG